MNRRKFLGLTTGVITVAGTGGYILSDKANFTRADIQTDLQTSIQLQPGEKDILYLASLAPSGHNTQPWLVKYREPYHWIICNDKTKWLPAVDPTQRETILSIGAFIQNLEYAAAAKGYVCEFTLLSATAQDEEVVEVKLKKQGTSSSFDIKRIIERRTVRSNYQNAVLTEQDINFLKNNETGFVYYLPNTSKEHQWLNEQTIEANRQQAYRDDAQSELSSWIRFSTDEAKLKCDGLTTASMEIDGIAGWVLRNFYDQKNVMQKKFREQSIDKIKEQVSQSAGWVLITSKDGSVNALLETGKRMQRLFLQIRERNIAFHPMTQILEERPFQQQVNAATGINEIIQFILRTGYIKNYPAPVSLRRPLDRIIKT